MRPAETNAAAPLRHVVNPWFRGAGYLLCSDCHIDPGALVGNCYGRCRGSRVLPLPSNHHQWLGRLQSGGRSLGTSDTRGRREVLGDDLQRIWQDAAITEPNSEFGIAAPTLPRLLATAGRSTGRTGVELDDWIWRSNRGHSQDDGGFTGLSALGHRAGRKGGHGLAEWRALLGTLRHYALGRRDISSSQSCLLPHFRTMAIRVRSCPSRACLATSASQAAQGKRDGDQRSRVLRGGRTRASEPLRPILRAP